ncbi:MAG: DUF3996 domain-containing protein [Treponema sp.]|nr:DUF3996 domain-containing protein [Treponema sp.]
MKKPVLIIVFAAFLATGAVFADHPKGWGVGVQGGFDGGWIGSDLGSGAALSLKIPYVPVFWAVNLGLGSSHFRVGLSGDYYFIDKPLVPAANLHWFLGGGGWIHFYSYSRTERGVDSNYTSLAFGARVPIGLSWQPLPWLEVFADFAPSLGVAIDTDGKYKDGGGTEHKWHDGGVRFPAGGWGGDLGVRFWF